MTKKTLFYLFATLVFINFSHAQTNETVSVSVLASTSTSTVTLASTTLPICQALNSINIYSNINILIIQKHLQTTYFPKIKLTGFNDLQTKYYIGKYQYAFGLIPTGALSEGTVKLLVKQNNCFDLEEKVLMLEKATVTKKINQIDIISDLFLKYIYPATTTPQ